MQVFYSTDHQNDHLLLDKEESAHALVVLRKSIGDDIFITDGKGQLFTCEIIDTTGKKVLAKIKSKEVFPERNNKLHIAIAPTKNNDRFEWFLEKACEFGIEEITPIICNRSERKVIKPERLEKILLSSMKQSLNFHLTSLHPVQKLSVFLSTHQANTANKLIAHCYPGSKSFLQNYTQNNCIVLVGPEGDFDEAELKMAQDALYLPISLGDSRLRTETAGIAVAHEFQIGQRNHI